MILAGKYPSAPSISTATERVSTHGPSVSPWPTILEQLPEYEPDTLLLSLEFYRESVVRRVMDDSGRVIVAMVDIAEVARGLSAGVSLASGILPGDESGPNTLFWARSSGSTRLGIWVGPRVWRLSLRSIEPGGKDRRFRLAFPGLIFVCRPDASGAYVFGAARRPRNQEEVLHHCPAPNVFASGKICPGDHAFARDPLKLPAEFFLSKFRLTGDTRGGKSRKHPDDISRLWDELDGQDSFPTDDLVPMLTVQQAFDLTL
jgi:E2/UBC family protein D